MPQPRLKLTDRFWAACADERYRRDEKRPTGEGWRTYPEGKRMFPKIGNHTLRTFLQKADVFKGCVMSSEHKLRREVWYRPKAK